MVAVLLVVVATVAMPNLVAAAASKQNKKNANLSVKQIVKAAGSAFRHKEYPKAAELYSQAIAKEPTAKLYYQVPTYISNAFVQTS